MRIDSSKKIRDVSGEHILIRVAEGQADMTEVVGLNESAMQLYRDLAGRDFTVDDAVECLTAQYEVDPETARRDAEEWVKSMREQGLIVD